jgi:two-component system OmpR family sensor kinase
MRALGRALVLRFSITMLVALLLMALWGYLGVRRSLQHQLDEALASSSRLEVATLLTNRSLAIQSGPTELAEFLEVVNRFVVARDSSGRIVAANTALAQDLPLDLVPFTRALEGGTAWGTSAWQGIRIRSAYVPAPPAAAPTAVIQVAASVQPLAREIRRLLALLLATSLLAVAATTVGAGWLARSSLAPVKEITEQARSVKAGRSNQRITAQADVLEFRGLVQVLNDMLERLERAFEEQRRIIADVGHDLRTPLTAMRGEVEIALRGERSPERYRAVLGSVLEEIDHLAMISEQLMIIARLTAGDLVPVRAGTDVAALAEAAVRGIQSRSDHREIRLVPAGEAATAAVDARLLGLVLDQLLDNIVRHTPPGARALIQVASDPAWVTVTVEDDGPGVPEEVLPDLLKPFYRADAARPRNRGAGLGLTVAMAVVEAHHGTIRASRSRLGGLAITIQLPRDGTPAAARPASSGGLPR